MTKGPATKAIPNIWRSARTNENSPVSSGQKTPQMNAAASQPPPLIRATKAGISKARRRARSPAGPGGGTGPACFSGASQSAESVRPAPNSSAKPSTK